MRRFIGLTTVGLVLLAASGAATSFAAAKPSKPPLFVMTMGSFKSNDEVWMTLLVQPRSPGTTCDARTRFKKRNPDFGKKKRSITTTTTARGARWSWEIPKTVPKGTWRFDVTCQKSGVKKHLTDYKVADRGKGAGTKSGLWVAGSLKAERLVLKQDGVSGIPPAALYPEGSSMAWVAALRPDIPYFPGAGGDAMNWANSVRIQKDPLNVGRRPRIGAVVVATTGQIGAGEYGHLAYVTAVNGPEMTISEAGLPNQKGPTRTIVWTSVNLEYIYRRGESEPEVEPTPTPAPTATPSPPPPVAVREILVTRDKYRDGNDGWGRTTAGKRFYLTPGCRQVLIGSGVPLRIVPNAEIEAIEQSDLPDCIKVATPNNSTTDVARVVITPDKREEPNDGWLERPDGVKYSVDANCRWRMLRAGVPIVVISEVELNNIDNTPQPQGDSCPLGGPDTRTKDALYIGIPKEKYPDGFDGWLVRANGTTVYTDATCRRFLISQGMPLKVMSYDDIIAMPSAPQPLCDDGDILVPGMSPAQDYLLVELKKREAPNEAWLRDSGGVRLYAPPECRAQLLAGGMLMVVLPWERIEAVPSSAGLACLSLAPLPERGVRDGPGRHWQSHGQRSGSRG